MRAAEWVAARPQDLVWREWNEHAAVYDLASGATHVIHVLALEILTLLMQRPLSVDALAEDLADAMPAELDREGARAQIEQQLQLLNELGLIRSAYGPP